MKPPIIEFPMSKDGRHAAIVTMLGGISTLEQSFFGTVSNGTTSLEYEYNQGPEDIDLEVFYGMVVDHYTTAMANIMAKVIMLDSDIDFILKAIKSSTQELVENGLNLIPLEEFVDKKEDDFFSTHPKFLEPLSVPTLEIVKLLYRCRYVSYLEEYLGMIFAVKSMDILLKTLQENKAPVVQLRKEGKTDG